MLPSNDNCHLSTGSRCNTSPRARKFIAFCVFLAWRADVSAFYLDISASWPASSCGTDVLLADGSDTLSTISGGSKTMTIKGRAPRYLSDSRKMRASWSMVADGSSSGARKARRTQNVEGNLFVDESCIDCDTCRWMQGDTFVSVGGKSAVVRQPKTEEERRGAYRAMSACPTFSIRLEKTDPVAKMALDDFPFPVDAERLPGVFHTGFHAENSFGCSPWLVQRPEGNVMVDSPRFHPRLAEALEKKGGVSLMVLSHIDDVGDHERWKNSFPKMRRIMHKADVKSHGDTGNVEVQLDSDTADGLIGGFDFWDLADDLRVLHTPGHSLGSITLLYRPPSTSSVNTESNETVAFTGDHLALSGRTGALTGFPRYGYDLNMQSKSMELLARPDIPFRWILPGHGRMMRFSSEEDRVSQIKVAASNVKTGRD